MSTRTIFFAIAMSIVFASPQALAGCIGAAVGDGCIGVPTPHDDRDWDREQRDYDRDHRYHETIIEKRRHHHHYDDD